MIGKADIRQKRHNSRVAAICITIVFGMVGAAYAAVPLYNIFCRVTGFGGTPAIADIVVGSALDRDVTVRFNANVARGMPWKFSPVQRTQTLKVGEVGLAHYRAENLTDRTIIGTATFNVTPQKVGVYFAKIECFCFTEQKLAPGEVADLPVTYFVDPAIDQDPYLDDVTTITLSYTFFEIDQPEATENPEDTENKLSLNSRN